MEMKGAKKADYPTDYHCHLALNTAEKDTDSRVIVHIFPTCCYLDLETLCVYQHPAV